jgi:CubicO group peptidase (beta-lactamase class C family)
MYITATHLVSVLTGRPYSVFLRERIFDPLGLPRGTATVSPLEAEKSGNLSNSWYVKGNDTFRTPFWIKSSSAKLIEGAGGIIIDARGLVRSSSSVGSTISG